MKGERGMHRVLIGVAIGVAAIFAVTSGCALLEDEQTAKGRKLYHHYCMHCHGENGKQQEGFNWERMPDPRPRDLSESAAMSTFSDEEIFHTISREMKDTTLPEVLNDENYFAVPTMPTFKYTLSEKELWAVVGYVRTLHGGSLEYDLEGRKNQLEAEFNAAKAEYDQAKTLMDEAVAKKEAEAAAKEAAAEAAAIAAGKDPDDIEYEEDETLLPEEEAFEKASEKFETAKMDFESFAKRPKMSQVRRPNLTVSDEEQAKLAEEGKHLYSNKYGCNGCHSIGDVGGLVGPALDRAGFRLNDTWVYRWIMYPQGMKKHTRMPNLGFNDHDAKAVTAYLETLRAPKPDNPIAAPE
jgi:mono/diheme cytochrome c family protein